MIPLYPPAEFLQQLVRGELRDVLATIREPGLFLRDQFGGREGLQHVPAVRPGEFHDDFGVGPEAAPPSGHGRGRDAGLFGRLLGIHALCLLVDVGVPLRYQVLGHYVEVLVVLILRLSHEEDEGPAALEAQGRHRRGRLLVRAREAVELHPGPGTGELRLFPEASAAG
jgi:hypothetical protein